MLHAHKEMEDHTVEVTAQGYVDGSGRARTWAADTLLERWGGGGGWK